jgi:hypothetical protein
VSNLSRPGITGGGINLINPGAPGQLPDEGMLPGPTPNNQNLYLPHPLKSVIFLFQFREIASPR